MAQPECFRDASSSQTRRFFLRCYSYMRHISKPVRYFGRMKLSNSGALVA